MKPYILTLYKKYKDLIPYTVFGILTTLINIISYWFFAHPCQIAVMPSTILAWVLAVLFAYLTNRKWVFHSKARRQKEIIREVTTFFLCRFTTGVIDWLCMYIFVDVMELNDVVIKTAANILVILLNYLASRLVIFRKR